MGKLKIAFSILLFIIAVLLLIVGLYMEVLHFSITYLIGGENMGSVLDSMESQLPVLDLGSNSLLISGILFIIPAIILIIIGIILLIKHKK